MRRAPKRVWKLSTPPPRLRLTPLLVTTDYEVYPRQRCHPPSSFAKSPFDDANIADIIGGGGHPTPLRDYKDTLALTKRVSPLNKYLCVFTCMYIFLFVNRVTLLKASEFHLFLRGAKSMLQRDMRERERTATEIVSFISWRDYLNRWERGEREREEEKNNLLGSIFLN